MRELPSYLRVLDGGGGEESGPALSMFGPVRAGLTTKQTTQNQVLSELLNDLERRIDDLRFKFFTAFDISSQDMELPAEQNLSGIDTDIIKE